MKLSVVIGTRNRWEPLVRCIESVLAQDYADFEIVILDDCSDRFDLRDLLRERFDDVRLRCFRSDAPSGVAGGRNRLMSLASGDVFCIIDDDAYFQDRDSLSRIAKEFENHASLGIVSVKVGDHREGTEALLVPFSGYWRKRRPGCVDEKQLVSYYLGTCHAIHRSVIQRCGGYQDNLVYGEEEVDLAYRVVEARFEILYLPQVVVHHCPQPSVVDSRNNRRKNELYYHVRNRFFMAYKYLPWRFVPTYLAAWLSIYFVRACKEGTLGGFGGGLLAGLRESLKLPRTTLTPASIAYLKAHYGRLWY